MSAHVPSTDLLIRWVNDARQRTLDLVHDLSDRELLGPRLRIVNPLLWEIGHVAHFQEWWVLRHALGQSPSFGAADALYDSAKVAHDTRWELPLPSRARTIDYLLEVRDRVLALLHAREPSEQERYFIQLTLHHEDMHDEAFLYTRQTHGWRPPAFASLPVVRVPSPDPAPGDVEVPGGTFSVGSAPDEPFVFDNEKWAHPVQLEPFRIARVPVTQGELAAAFVDAGGYGRREWWSASGWQWRESVAAQHPVYWRREGDVWLRRCFDAWVPLELELPALHVSWYEAEAYCAFAGRRLPLEAEWEAAAAGAHRRRFPWGDGAPDAARAHLDGTSIQCLPVAALPAGDSASGCRQMIGNVWEWVQDDFLPYPGFATDPYREYSEPWFGTHKVLRGGCFATRARLIHNRWRNFYTPDRRDVWAGFRTCARTR